MTVNHGDFAGQGAIGKRRDGSNECLTSLRIFQDGHLADVLPATSVNSRADGGAKFCHKCPHYIIGVESEWGTNVIIVYRLEAGEVAWVVNGVFCGQFGKVLRSARGGLVRLQGIGTLKICFLSKRSSRPV